VSRRRQAFIVAVSSAGVVEFELFVSRGRDGRRLGRQAQRVEEFLDRRRIEQCGDDLHRAAAVGTTADVDRPLHYVSGA